MFPPNQPPWEFPADSWALRFCRCVDTAGWCWGAPVWEWFFPSLHHSVRFAQCNRREFHCLQTVHAGVCILFPVLYYRWWFSRVYCLWIVRCCTVACVCCTAIIKFVLFLERWRAFTYFPVQYCRWRFIHAYCVAWALVLLLFVCAATPSQGLGDFWNNDVSIDVPRRGEKSVCPCGQTRLHVHYITVRIGYGIFGCLGQLWINLWNLIVCRCSNCFWRQHNITYGCHARPIVESAGWITNNVYLRWHNGHIMSVEYPLDFITHVRINAHGVSVFGAKKGNIYHVHIALEEDMIP